MTEQEADKALEYLRTTAPAYGAAKAKRVLIENSLKSKKAILMANSDEKTIGGKEMEAYAHHDYMVLVQGLAEATEIEETIKMKAKAAELTFEKYKVEQFNARVQARAVS